LRDLSLHVLDLLENSIRAGATVICVTVGQDPAQNRLDISVEDNGPGLPTETDKALDPFFTTKAEKRTGLGLSLFRATAERAGGSLQIGRSPLGGLAVKAMMQLDHVDRIPLGDLAATLSSPLYTNPELDVWCRIETPETRGEVRASSFRVDVPPEACNPIAVARRMAEGVRQITAILLQ
jgi:signal transduction histidine kinase